MKSFYRILLLEASGEDVERVSEVLKREYIPAEVAWVNGLPAFTTALQGGWAYDLFLAEDPVPGPQGDQALALARKLHPEVPFIFLSATQDEERAVACLRQGATDCVPKTNLARLAPVVRRALEEAREAAGRREAEAANSRLVSLLRATLESTSEGILVVDLAGKISTYNRKFMSLCGIPDYVMAPMEMDRVLQFLLDQFQDPEAFLSEARLLTTHPDRESFGVLNLKGERMLEEAGRPYRVGNQTVGRVFSFRDITDREQSDDDLKRTLEQGQTLLEAFRAGRAVAWGLTEDSLVLDGAAADLLGFEPGAGPRDLPALEALVHPDDLDLLSQALERPQGAAFEARLRKADGAWVWTRWHLDRDPGGGYHGLFLEVEGNRQEDPAQRLAWTTTLAANMTRALAGPLQALKASAQTPEAAQAVAAMEALLQEMADATQVVPAPAAQFSLNDLVEKLRPWAEATLGQGIRLKLETSPNLPALRVNPARMEPVLMNLILNARDALNGAGEVTVRTGSHDEAAGPKGPVFLEVQDSGPGLSPRVKNRMFEPFFTTKEKAHGLGLSVVRVIVEGYGGSIRVDSRPGQGACIRVLLPQSA